MYQNVNEIQDRVNNLNPTLNNMLDLFRGSLEICLEENQEPIFSHIYLGNPGDCDYQDVMVPARYLGSVAHPDDRNHLNRYWLCKNHSGNYIVASTFGSSDRATCAFKACGNKNGIGGLGFDQPTMDKAMHA